MTIQYGATTLLDNGGVEDEGTVEGPSLVQSGNKYVLFFSSGCFTGPNYTVNYATANDITGPYKRAVQALFVTGNYSLDGPGGMSMYKDAKHMVFHARYGKGRALYDAVISFLVNEVTPLLRLYLTRTAC